MAQKVGEDVSGSRAVRSVHYNDRHVGQFRLGVEALNRRIIPLRYLAKIEVSDQLPGKS